MAEKHHQQHNWTHGKYSQSPVLCTFYPKYFKIFSHVNICISRIVIKSFIFHFLLTLTNLLESTYFPCLIASKKVSVTAGYLLK